MLYQIIAAIVLACSRSFCQQSWTGLQTPEAADAGEWWANENWEAPSSLGGSTPIHSALCRGANHRSESLIPPQALRLEYERVKDLGDKLFDIGGRLNWESFRPALEAIYKNNTECGGRPNLDVIVMLKSLFIQQDLSLCGTPFCWRIWCR